MKIVIAGAGSVGRSVALELLDHGHECTIIDKQPEKLHIASVADADWVLADACSPDSLADAGVADADVMVAATGDDKANLVISLLAKIEFAVPKVVARLNNPKNEWLFDASWGVDISVSMPRIMTALVEEAVTTGDPVPLFSFNNADANLYALVIPGDSPIAGAPIDEVPMPAGTLLTAILRAGKALPPATAQTFAEGDELLLLIPDDGEAALHELHTLVNAPQSPNGVEDADTADQPEN